MPPTSQSRAGNEWASPGVGAVMTTVGFIGSGMIGGTVARLSVAAGHSVVLSNSRGPRTLDGLVGELGPLLLIKTLHILMRAASAIYAMIKLQNAFSDC